MGKISPVSAKYIVHSTIQIDGVVDRPDVIGAVFGQTEGLLGADLELRELQRSGRIGRIEVNTDVKGGKTEGAIIIPSSLDKEETVIVAAALETIQRIGPCNARVRITKIEDIRISKRNYVIERAKELLRQLQDEILPDSQEITEEVAQSVRVMAITEFGRDRLPAGPGIEDAEEVIVVEGRADVINLLKQGFKNVIALGGTNVPRSIIELSKEKVITLFVDGDRGGDLIIKAIMDACEVDYVIKAPDGKEVEELTKKEIHKALRSKVAAEQAKMEIKDLPKRSDTVKSIRNAMHPQQPQPKRFQPAAKPMPQRSAVHPKESKVPKPSLVTQEQKDKFKQLLEDLIGTRGAYILDEKMNILGKVPATELTTTMKSLSSGVFAVVFDGTITKDILIIAERTGTQFIIGMDTAVNPKTTNIGILTSQDF
ncbi:MAG: DNA primase DnaG [Candidatus Woesearchaeota archaeon]